MQVTQEKLYYLEKKSSNITLISFKSVSDFHSTLTKQIAPSSALLSVITIIESQNFILAAQCSWQGSLVTFAPQDPLGHAILHQLQETLSINLFAIHLQKTLSYSCFHLTSIITRELHFILGLARNPLLRCRDLAVRYSCSQAAAR
jgi:hypothetical protein